MVDISVTAASVANAGSGQIKFKTAGEAITAGEPIYFDSTDSYNAKLCDCDLSEAAAQCKGIAVADAADGQPVAYVDTGDITFNAVLTAGTIYVLSGTAGGIAPSADLASSDYVTILGVASSTTNLKLNIYISGVQIA